MSMEINGQPVESPSIFADVDRFICRREGHKPSVTITSIPAGVEASCKCLRCDQWVAAGRDSNGA